MPKLFIFCWLLFLVVKINTATFEVDMTNHRQDISKKQIQQQSPESPHK